MGASSSTNKSSSPQPQLEQETLAASTGSLPTLRAAFSNLSHPESHTIPLSSLHSTFSLNFSSEPPQFPLLLPHLAPSLVAQFFPDSAVNWVHFLRGYNRCCARMPVSSSLNNILRLYSAAAHAAGIPCELEFHSNDADEGKVEGCLMPADLTMLMWACWIMARPARGGGGGGDGVAVVVELPDVGDLVLSAFVSAGAVGDDENVWGFDGLGRGGVSVSVEKLHMWVLATVPGIVLCLSQFVQERLKACAAASRDDMSPVLSTGDSPSCIPVHDKLLLTCGRAWAISLTLRNTLGEELLGACFPGIFDGSLDNLLYRSTIHGKGLSRFWSNVGGYHGPLLILISGNLKDDCEGDSSNRKWVIGILTEQGFENRDTFYGSSGYLYAISPIFRVLPPSGKDKNFMYCHLHPTARYEQKPKPVGLAFGGTVGSERIFIDEDFAQVIIRHHAFDKTYQHGSLIPNQGFLPVEASLLETEVWGFGGKAGKEKQDSYRKREQLFTDQRRKVDLKTFGNWEDSPEKMMMDMTTDPNRVQREDR